MNQIQGDNFEDQAADLYQTFIELLDTFKPDLVIIERFQNRGFIRGAQGEVVTFMSSMLCTLCRQRNIEHRLIMASTWKTGINRAGVDLKAGYSWAWKKPRRIVPHRVDSGLIALYGALKKFTKDDAALIRKTIKHAGRAL